VVESTPLWPPPSAPRYRRAANFSSVSALPCWIRQLLFLEADTVCQLAASTAGKLATGVIRTVAVRAVRLRPLSPAAAATTPYRGSAGQRSGNTVALTQDVRPAASKERSAKKAAAKAARTIGSARELFTEVIAGFGKRHKSPL